MLAFALTSTIGNGHSAR